MLKLRYGNTTTFFIQGSRGGLLVDTDYAGTLSAFYKALKQSDLKLTDIEYVMATHYHPDHMGLVGELMKLGTKLLLIDAQKDHVHDPDRIFGRDRITYVSVDESLATVISCGASRDLLRQIGISGEIIHTASHSEDSVSLMLDNGDCLAGDLDPFEYIAAYEENAKLKDDWEKVLSFTPKTVYFAHRPEKNLN